MATVTFNLPDELYERLKRAAVDENRPVEELLVAAAEMISASHLAEPEPLTRDDEMRRLREVMGDSLMRFDADEFLKTLGIEPMSEEEVGRILAALPVLDPPASQTLIHMRDEERY